MSDFEFPTNIRQIGSITRGLKIYMEDYVCTYLSQYVESAGYEEKIALLVGRCMVIDGQTVLFINGAVTSDKAVSENGITVFNEDGWIDAKEQMKKYFPDMEIVGWSQSQPSYGTFLNSNYANYHIQNFKQHYQVLFVMDPIEKVNAFYVWNEKYDDLVETKGYFIYYEKNKLMHEYILDNRAIKLKVQNVIEENVEHENEDIKQIYEATKKVSANSRGRRSRSDGRRVVNMLVSLSAVLFIISFIMGAGLIQNEDRITSLERELVQLTTSYKDLLVQARSGSTATVFAAQETDTIEKNTTEPEQNTTEPEQNTIEPEQNITELENVNPNSMSPELSVAQIIKENGNEIVKAEAILTRNNDSEDKATETPKETPEEAPKEAPKETPEEAPKEAPKETPVVAAIEPETPYKDIPNTYTVKQGDNLGSISIRFYGDRSMMNKIMEINQMDDPNKIYFGKVIKLPRP